ncbi:monooxygenase [Solimicrobium silvestre]|uniref:Monooxygenase n=1 Tax=Solimicrobium silvestre TaxID=2099400 RepID=A0A2S9GXR1_9BURK|nr:monooxygenase [Solimicrobium silvestre]PRC92514.1 hypothetical protein S2091_2889 [Solimicrobium silvestre]
MITVLISFNLAPGTTRTDALHIYRNSAKKWASNVDLIEKYYYFDEQTLLGGGVYIWKSIEAARQWHGPDYVAMVESVYGNAPRIQILDTLIHIEPTTRRIVEYGN